MILPFVLLVILVVWALKDSEMYAKEAVVHGAIGLACVAGVVINFQGTGLYFVVPICLQDVYLLVKLVGNPSAS